MPEKQKVTVVTETYWDTENNAEVLIIGVYSSKEVVPDRYTGNKSGHHHQYKIDEYEVDPVIEPW